MKTLKVHQSTGEKPHAPSSAEFIKILERLITSLQKFSGNESHIAACRLEIEKLKTES